MPYITSLIIEVLIKAKRPLSINEIVNGINSQFFNTVDYDTVYGAIYREWEKDHYVIFEDIDVSPHTFYIDEDYIDSNGDPIVGP